ELISDGTCRQTRRHHDNRGHVLPVLSAWEIAQFSGATWPHMPSNDDAAPKSITVTEHCAFRVQLQREMPKSARNGNRPSASSPLLKYRSDRAGSSAPAITTPATPLLARGDKDDRYGLFSVEEECIGQCTRNRLSRGSGPDQQPHQDAEIVASDVDQVGACEH